MRITAQFARNCTKAGRYSDSSRTGLFLLVGKQGSKSWGQRLRVNGVRKDIGLGSFKHLSLKDAREKAFENQQAVKNGNGLVRKTGVPTFREAAAKVIAMNEGDWRSPKTKQNWENVFRQYVFPSIGDMPIDKPITGDIMSILEPLSAKKDTVRKIRQRTSQVFQWAIGHEYRADDPAGPALLAAMPKLKAKRKRKHNPALPYDQVQGVLDAVRDSDSYVITKLCFEFVVVTAVRSGEARGARWSEIDLDAKTWTIPESRTKTGMTYRIPLSDQAIKILKQAKEYSATDLVFRSPRGKALSDNTLSKVLRELGYQGQQTVHGFRSCFRDWAAEKTDAPGEIVEFCLAHIVGKGAELAYRRTDYFEKRRVLMQEWADYLA